MNSSNPLLNTTELPAFSAIVPEQVLPALLPLLEQHRSAVEALLEQGATSWTPLMAELEAWEERISRVWAPVSHLHGVKDSAALRKVYQQAQEALTEHQSQLGQHQGLYRAVQALRDSPTWDSLERSQQAVIEDLLLNFRLSGVSLEETQRQRFRDISNQLARLGSEFEEALLDATEAWHEHFDDAEALRGLPASALEMARQLAQERDLPGWLVNLQGPSYQAVMTYAEDRALRQRVYHAYGTRASEQGPHAGRFDNSQRMEQIIALRHESSGLLGFANAAECSLATKMAPDADAVLSFLNELVTRARPVAQRELQELRAFAATELGIEDLQPWDVAFAAERLRLQRYALSEEELKPYFPLPKVLDGLLTLSSELFGVRFRKREGVDTWHPDVSYYEVLDEQAQVLAGFYVDLYARANKRGGAWMGTCHSRFREGSVLHRPVAFLCCNFPPPGNERPSLLSHDDVLTLFHEFGHGLHHMLTEVDWPSVSGISGVEWDAVELPSQFMENFAWSREALDRFARHWQSDEVLPDDLHQRMLAARHFHAGLFLLRQLEFALFDFHLHRDFQPEAGPQVQQTLDTVRQQVSVLPPPSWHRFAHSFGHIFAGGYAAGYYSYLWAERLSADAFGRFEENGVFDAASGRAFRQAVLAVGGSRPALESFIEFRGREPQSDALLRSYGLAA